MTPEAIALLASTSFALFAVYGWLGLRHSMPLTATIVSLAARTITLGAAVAFSGGVAEYKAAAMTVSVALGVLQSAISLLTFIGLHKIGTSRSQPLRNSYPIWSAMIGARVVIVSPIVATTRLFSLVISLIFLRGKEQVTRLTIIGTVAVVAGTVAIAIGK